VLRKARDVGKEISSRGCFLVTGACPGIPYEAAKAAKESGGFTIGFSPASNLAEHVRRYKYPEEYLDFIVFTGMGLKGRNVPLVRSCDGIIVIDGGMGTLNEFTIAIDEGKTIGVLEGSGGITDLIPEILKSLTKKKSKIVSFSSANQLTKELIRVCYGKMPNMK
jgi:uncharacterized protein (TIGR00725 family)